MKIGIVGLGLIGGSLYKDLLSHGYEVVAVSKSQSGKYIYKTYDALQDCDIVFVCTPMNKTLKILDELEKYLSQKTIVSDVCSLKEFVCKKKRPYRFVPSHPMAGTEKQGFENSLEGLFVGAKWVITPVFEPSEELVDIIKDLGAIPVITTPKEHDEAVALISHMPMVISQAIFKTAEGNNLAITLASSGFRDMTRLAMSNTEMAKDMVEMNSDNIQTSILKLYKTIGDLTSSDYQKQIEEIRHNRQLMF